MWERKAIQVGYRQVCVLIRGEFLSCKFRNFNIWMSGSGDSQHNAWRDENIIVLMECIQFCVPERKQWIMIVSVGVRSWYNALKLSMCCLLSKSAHIIWGLLLSVAFRSIFQYNLNWGNMNLSYWIIRFQNQVGLFSFQHKKVCL